MILCLRISPKSALFQPKKRESVAKRHSSSNPIRSASQSVAFYSPEYLGSKQRFSRGYCGILRCCRLERFSLAPTNSRNQVEFSRARWRVVAFVKTKSIGGSPLLRLPASLYIYSPRYFGQSPHAIGAPDSTRSCDYPRHICLL